MKRFKDIISDNDHSLLTVELIKLALPRRVKINDEIMTVFPMDKNCEDRLVVFNQRMAGSVACRTRK
eukprot:12468052-Heterocapsa_arctica.AAC.1